MKALIYARFSSALQDSRSIEDQVRICRERADRENWEVAAVHADYAISGAIRERPALNALIGDVDSGLGTIVLAESLDRISRDQEHVAGIWKRLRHSGATLVTLSEGEIGELHIGLKGTMAALFRKDLAEKVRRGQSGRAAAGKCAGGRAYGYRVVRALDARGELIRGEREIVPEEAEVVRRIFAEAAAEASPRAVAAALNRDRIPSPTGGLWRASTILSMLRNEIYVGRVVYGARRRTYHPDDHRRSMRRNPADSVTIGAAPELRIVEDDLWLAVAGRRERNAGIRPERQRRPARLLSGLAFCGCCGGSWTVIGTNKWGCSRRKDTGACENRRTIQNGPFEARVLKGLEGLLLDPALVETYVRERRAARARRTADSARRRALLERRLTAADSKIRRLVDGFGDRGGDIEEVRAALAAAKADQRSAAAELGEIGAEKVVELGPGLAEDYRRRVETLREAFASERPEARLAAVPTIRALIGRIDVFPADEGPGTRIDLAGRLATILSMATGEPPPERMLTVVPLERHGRSHTLLRAAV